MCCVFAANVISAWAIAMITSLYVRRGPRLVDISDKLFCWTDLHCVYARDRLISLEWEKTLKSSIQFRLAKYHVNMNEELCVPGEGRKSCAAILNTVTWCMSNNRPDISVGNSYLEPWWRQKNLRTTKFWTRTPISEQFHCNAAASDGH